MAIDRASFTKTRHQNIKVHKDGITFWFDFTIDGKRYNRIFKSNPNHTKADRLKTAVSRLEAIRTEITRTQDLDIDTKSTITQYFERLKIQREWKEAYTYNQTCFFNRHIEPTLGSMAVADVKPKHLTSFNATLRGLSIRTKKRAYEILVPIFNLAIEDELIVSTPVKTSHVPKRDHLAEKTIVTDAQTKYRTVHAAIHQIFGSNDVVTVDGKKVQCHENPHHRAVFLLAFYGRRRTEAASLKWEDIDFDNDNYTVRGSTSKINKDMTFALPEDVKAALLEFRSSKGSIFHAQNYRYYFPLFRKVTGIEDFSMHWMRNLAVSALSSMGMEAVHLSSMLGHTDVTTVNKYLSLQRERSTAATNDMAQKLLNGSDKTTV